MTAHALGTERLGASRNTGVRPTHDKLGGGVEIQPVIAARRSSSAATSYSAARSAARCGPVITTRPSAVRSIRSRAVAPGDRRCRWRAQLVTIARASCMRARRGSGGSPCWRGSVDGIAPVDGEERRPQERRLGDAVVAVGERAQTRAGTAAPPDGRETARRRAPCTRCRACRTVAAASRRLVVTHASTAMSPGLHGAFVVGVRIAHRALRVAAASARSARASPPRRRGPSAPAARRRRRRRTAARARRRRRAVRSAAGSRSS